MFKELGKDGEQQVISEKRHDGWELLKTWLQRGLIGKAELAKPIPDGIRLW